MRNRLHVSLMVSICLLSWQSIQAHASAHQREIRLLFDQHSACVPKAIEVDRDKSYPAFANVNPRVRLSNYVIDLPNSPFVYLRINLKFSCELSAKQETVEAYFSSFVNLLQDPSSTSSLRVPSFLPREPGAIETVIYRRNLEPFDKIKIDDEQQVRDYFARRSLILLDRLKDGDLSHDRLFRDGEFMTLAFNTLRALEGIFRTSPHNSFVSVTELERLRGRLHSYPGVLKRVSSEDTHKLVSKSGGYTGPVEGFKRAWGDLFTGDDSDPKLAFERTQGLLIFSDLWQFLNQLYGGFSGALQLSKVQILEAAAACIDFSYRSFALANDQEMFEEARRVGLKVVDSLCSGPHNKSRRCQELSTTLSTTTPARLADHACRLVQR